MVHPCLEDNCYTAVGIIADLASGPAAGAQAGSSIALDFELLDVRFDMEQGDSEVGIEAPPCSVRVTDLGWTDRLLSENIPSAVADTVHRKALPPAPTVVAVDNHLSPYRVPDQDCLHRCARTAMIHDEDGQPVAREREDLVEYLPISSAALWTLMTVW